MRRLQDEAGAALIEAHEHTIDTDDHSPHRGDPPARRSRRPLFVALWASAVVVYVADQLTKIWALSSLEDRGRIDLVGDALGLQLIRNPGAAFSIGEGSTWVLTVIAVAVMVFVVIASRRLGSRAWAWALGLLLGGSLGNLTDRLVREPGPGRGHVIDFIDYFGWFIGNVADIAIVGAAVVIAVLALRGIGVDGSRASSGGGRHEAGADHTDGTDSTEDETTDMTNDDTNDDTTDGTTGEPTSRDA